MTSSRSVTQYGGRTFDRVPQWDAANDNFRMSLAAPQIQLPKSKTHTRVSWLDQGSEGGCTGYSSATVLSFAPHGVPKMPASFAEFLYAEAKEYDEYPGDNYTGSSILGACKAAAQFGYISSYNWAPTVDEICAGLVEHSAVLFGINWYDSMFNVDDEGRIKIAPAAKVAGGHAIACGAYKTLKDGRWFRLDNSWGKSWGHNGSAWIGEGDVIRLLAESGEVAVPVKKVPMPPLQSHGRVDPGTGNVVNPNG